MTYLLYITLLWMIVSLVGYAAYRLGEAETWEQGIKMILVNSYNFLYREVSGKVTTEKVVNNALILNNEEALELVSRLDGHPYDTPSIISYTPNSNGILWLDVSAVGLAPTYKDLTQKDMAKMIHHVIQNFYMETRGIQVQIVFKIVAKTRLYAAIILSQEGKRFLEKQNQNTIASKEHPHKVVKALSEEVEMPKKAEDKDNDSRV